MPAARARQPRARAAGHDRDVELAAQPDELDDLGRRRRAARRRAAGPPRGRRSRRAGTTRGRPGSVSSRTSGSRASIARSRPGPSPRTAVAVAASFAMRGQYGAAAGVGSRPCPGWSAARSPLPSPCSSSLATGTAAAGPRRRATTPPRRDPPASRGEPGRRGPPDDRRDRDRARHRRTARACRCGRPTSSARGSTSARAALRGYVVDHGAEPLRRGHRPDRAQHRHGPARRAAPGRRSPSTATAVAPRIDDQTIVVPLGGVLPDGATTTVKVRFARDAADDARRLELAVHPRERHRQPLPLDPVGQPRDAVRPPQPRRPVRDAGQPARRLTSDHGPTSRCGVATTGTRTSRSADGADPGVRGDQRPRPRRHALAADYRTASATVGDTIVRVLLPARARRRPRCSTPRQGRAHASSRRGSGPTRTRAQDRPVRRRLRHGGPGRRLDPDRRRRREPHLPRHPRGRPPVVLRARRQRPGPRAVRRRGDDRLSSRAASSALRRGSRCGTATLDRSIYRYSLDLLLRAGLHPGRQPARRRARRDGLDDVLGGRCAATSPTTAGACRTRGRCSTRSTTRRRSTSRRAGARASRSSTEAPP